ncbi:putative leucine-rich repeat protein [Tanacetum coccineum]
MLVIVLFLLCIGSFVNADNVTSGITRSCIEKERQALLLVKENLVGAHNSLGNWGSEEEKKDCCKWVGVSCDNHTGHVIGLDLSNSSNRLVGNISTSLHVLHQLEYLNLSGIDFQSSPIPNFLGSLTSLRRVDISAANLSGPIPRHLSNLSYLLHLDLSHNILTGSIPFSFGDFTSLMYLDLSRNQLEGVIPRSFENSSSLVQLNLSENLLNGTLPSFAGCPTLKELVLHRNNLYGVVPYFTGCSSLSVMSLHIII